ncbi:MAG: ABC transporter ATP-binding protein [Candidatus Brocadiaceae bacterium]|nr:ABC transporter ATP-binding protein [Candidatus Brocadiaceae bacterium]
MNKKYKFTAKSREALLYFFKQRLRMIIFVIILGVLYSFAEAFSIGMLLPMISQIVGNSGSIHEKNIIVSSLYKTAESIPLLSPIYSVLLVFFVVIFLKNVLGYFREIFSVFLGLSVREHCQYTLFRRILSADYRFFLKQRLGDLEYRVITAPNQMNNLVSIIPDLVTEIFKCILIMSLLFIIAPKITIFFLIIGGLFFWLIRFLASRVSYLTGKARVHASSDVTVYCGQALQGFKLLRIFKAEKFWENLFNSSLQTFYSFARRDTIFAAMPSRLLESATFGILCFAIGWIVTRHGSNSMIGNIPILGVFVLAIQRLLPSLNAIGNKSMRFMSMLPYGEATYDAMRESYENMAPSGDKPYHFEHEIRFKEVSLRYDKGKSLVLNNLDFSIKKNLLTAIVGESGSGKTSILNLLLKVLEPTTGEILIDGVQLKDVDTNKWYGRIGYVGQEVFMFNGTIRENVLFGMKNGSDSEIYKALEMANAMEFVEKCDKRLDTIIGDNGVKLSGGQRQRLSIARALLRKPDILVFDEATSAVDNISEQLIKDTIKRLHKHTTIINVAHRLSTIKDADEIIVLKDGNVKEVGIFEELFQDGRYFKKLYDVGLHDEEATVDGILNG